MPADTLTEQIIKYLTDVHGLEENAVAQLRDGADASDDPQLFDVLRDHLTETEEQERLVRERLEALGASPSSVKDFAQRGWAAVAGLASRAAPDTTGKIAITAYMFEHLEIASYRCLKAVAERAADAETVALTDRILVEEQAAADRVSALLEQAALVGVPQTV